MTARNRRQRTPYETGDYSAMLYRMVTSLGKRLVKDGNPSDVADAVALARHLDETIAASIRTLVESGTYSWAQIGDELGMSRQGAYQRFGKRAASSPASTSASR